MALSHLPTTKHQGHQWTRVPLIAVTVALACMLGGCSITIPAMSSGSSVSTSPMTVSLRLLKGSDNSTLAIAPVYIHGQGPFQFIVDTGASVSILRRELARQLALAPAGSRQQVNGVGGAEQITFVAISNWRADRLALPHGTIGSGVLPFNTGGTALDGLLGSDVWSQFGKVTIDYDAATLTVYRSVAARPGLLSLARSGAALTRVGADGAHFAMLVTRGCRVRRKVTGNLPTVSCVVTYERHQALLAARGLRQRRDGN